VLSIVETEPLQQHSADSLSRRTFAATAKFLVVLALMIFLPAGSIHYWQGWLFWINFAVCCFAFNSYFLRHDPALVERRLRAGPAAEREPLQKRIQAFASIFVGAIFIVSAIDYRIGWSTVPTSVVVLGNVLVAIGFWLIFWVFRANSFASSTIELSAGQSVIDTGPYALVRHPMYAAAFLLFCGVPLALGSWWGLLVLLALIVVLVVRLLDEEVFLARNLPGYAEYCAKIPYRLLPGVW
jgi:protein-S-isoprenylcysteine O-methyltransferase Ste14